jgi:preprotein translocase subunit YajC
MFSNFTAIFLMTPGAGGQQGGGGQLWGTLLMFGAVIVIMYLLMIRPQQKRQKEHQKMLEGIKKGDKVVTTSGMHGTVTDIDGGSYLIQVADNVKITFEKTAIANKL